MSPGDGDELSLGVDALAAKLRAMHGDPDVDQILDAQLRAATPRQVIDMANEGKLDGLPDALQLRELVRRRGDHQEWIAAAVASCKEGLLGGNRQIWLLDQITRGAREAADADPLVAASIEHAMDMFYRSNGGMVADRGVMAFMDTERRARAAILHSANQKTLAYLLAEHPSEWYRRAQWGADPSRDEEVPDAGRPDLWGPDHPWVVLPLKMLRERATAGPDITDGLYRFAQSYLDQAAAPFFFGWLRAIEHRFVSAEIAAAERMESVKELLFSGVGLLRYEDDELARLKDASDAAGTAFKGTMMESFDDPGVRAADAAYRAREQEVVVAVLRRGGCEDLAQWFEREPLLFPE